MLPSSKQRKRQRAGAICNFVRCRGLRDYAIYLLDREGHITTWNPGAERIKHYTPDEIIGKHFSRFFTQEDVERGRPAELLRLAAERGRIEEEGWRVRKDGSRFWADVILTAIRDTTGELTGFAKVTRDFTDRKRAEEAVMLQLSGALLANMDVRKLLGAISASLREVVPHDAATLGLYEAQSETMMVQFLERRPTRNRSARRTPARRWLAGGAGLQNPRAGPARRYAGIARSLPAGVHHLTDLGMRSGCWVPLIHRGEAVGSSGRGQPHRSAFSQHDAEMLCADRGAGRHGSQQCSRLSTDRRSARPA